MLVGECDRALRRRGLKRGLPVLAKATTAASVGVNAIDRDTLATAGPDARRPAAFLAGEEAGRIPSGENDSGGSSRDCPCLMPGGRCGA